jgi:hypothetical protein
MSVDYQKKFVNLLATTDGRDKLMKGFSSLAKLVAAQTGSKEQALLSASLSESRSVLRLAGWLNNGVKIRNELFGSKVNTWNYAMVARLLGDAVYCINDNIAYYLKYMGADKAAVAEAVRRSFVGMFWGFLLAVIIDVRALLLLDPVAEKAAWRARVLVLTRDLCDLLNALSSVKYIASFELSPAASGALGVISASVSTFENWEKA